MVTNFGGDGESVAMAMVGVFSILLKLEVLQSLDNCNSKSEIRLMTLDLLCFVCYSYMCLSSFFIFLYCL